MFTSGSIANQFHEWDLNSNSVLSYAVETLEVRHVIVMGHYGCGGVAASMLPVSLPLDHPAHIAVQTWIQPIREIYQTSNRPEIAAHRNQHKHIPLAELPELHNPAFRALVEENVKANVNRIARSYVMRDHYASLALPQLASTSEIPNDPNSLKGTHVFIHGWVYDVENGEVMDLNVTVGPPGREIPPSPWPRAEIREREKKKQREEKASKERETMLAAEDGIQPPQQSASL
ncbi:carbonic anhydrase [Macrolepiota fuliginosa MF-IS2]|uniref:Carbonic anhydrase n=1 Tax=Macrolepiota fuliginosa MF-IS2 TaxID=1400762 RepID=A0A9P6C552_9AGAR|nr:carbonic anhydrase [Macrolepiota fuliginosa MF-IS2]